MSVINDVVGKSMTDEDGNEALTGSHKDKMLNSFFSKCFNRSSGKIGQEATSTLTLGNSLTDFHVTKTLSMTFLQAWMHQNRVDQMVSPQKC